jgi:hypothetical protein
MVSPPVVLTEAPPHSSNSPATVDRPVSALLLPSVPASATRAFAPFSDSTPSIVVIWPLANSSSAAFVRETDPVSTPSVPIPAAPPMSSVASAVTVTMFWT